MAYRQNNDSHTRQAPPRRRPQRRRPAPKKVGQRPPSGGPFSMKVVAFLFFAFVFIYIGHSAWAFVTPDVDTMVVRMNTSGTPQSIQGIIIRDEHVHYANSTGYVQFMVPENERVSVNAPIVSITNDPVRAQAALGYLATVENMASSTQARRPANGTDSGVQRINNDLTNIVNGRINSFTSINLAEIYALRDNLNQRINTRNQINTGSAIAAREPLAREYERHRAALDASTRNMYAVGSGIMSRLLDGHETSLTREIIGHLTRDDIRTIAEAEHNIQTPATEVQEGDPIFKTVGNVWHIAAYMPNDMVTFAVGTTRTVYLRNANTGDYEPHSLRVEHIEDGIRYSLVVFRNTRHVIEFMNQRNISIRTTSGVTRGLKIPDTAIVTNRHYRIPLEYIHGYAGSNYVLVLGEAGNTRVPISIDESTEYHVYTRPAAGLTVGSLLVPHDPDNGHIILGDTHVRVVNGVYAVVFGTVEFRTIDLGDSGLEAGYVLLDPSLNHRISEFSNIVIDASTVVAGQIVR